METALFLLVDGLTNGLVYALLALSLVLTFTVTRVVNIAQGEYVMLGALTLADLLQGRFPGTVYLLVGGLALCVMLDAARWRSDWKVAAVFAAGMVLSAAAAVGLVLASLALRLPVIGMMLVALLLVAPIGVLVYRFTVHPIPNASTIVFVIISVGVSMSVQGLGLLIWGANPYPVEPVASGGTLIGPVFVPRGGSAVDVSALPLLGAYAGRQSLAGIGDEQAWRAILRDPGRQGGRSRVPAGGSVQRHQRHAAGASHHGELRDGFHGRPEGLRRGRDGRTD
jgi:branched-chain amino acid transport system permease protein